MNRVTRELMIRAGRKDLISYARLMDRRYQPGRFHLYLAGLLERVERGEINRLAISVPPRHGKSRLASQEFVSWCFGRNPRLNVILAGHSQRLTFGHSRAIRSRLRSRLHQEMFPESGLNPTHQSIQMWGTNAGGQLLAAATTGEITGHGADLMVIDDPHSGMAEARSPTMREAVWTWYSSDAYTRLSPEGKILLIMTRWHVDDLAARILDPKRRQEAEDKGGIPDDWTVVNLRGIAKENDPFGRQPGEALWPERWTREKLLSRKAVMDPGAYAAEYDGDPVPDGGNVVGREDFVFIDPDQVPDGLKWRRFWDLATSEKRENDFYAGAKGAMDRDGNLIISNVTKGKWLWPRARTLIKEMAEVEGHLVGVEAQGGFKNSFDNLREVLRPDVPLKAYTWHKDKMERAWPWIAMAKNRRVKLVRGAWNQDFLDEAQQFPSGAHDDQVDAVSGLYVMLTSDRVILVA